MGILAAPMPVCGTQWALGQSLIPPGFSQCWAGWRYQTVSSQLGCNGVVGLAPSGRLGGGNLHGILQGRAAARLQPAPG